MQLTQASAKQETSIFKTAKYSQLSRFMCVSREVLQNLYDLLPVTAEILKTRGLQKRLHYRKTILRLDNQTRTKYSSKIPPSTDAQQGGH